MPKHRLNNKASMPIGIWESIDWYLKINVAIVDISICKKHSTEKERYINNQRWTNKASYKTPWEIKDLYLKINIVLVDISNCRMHSR